MILQANCKINLGLDVLRRREDGFHDLETVMLPVRELFDVVEVRRRGDNELRFRQRGLTVDCPAEENVCVKAFRLMQRRYGVGGVEITLDKCVPFGAGLGGGSADAPLVLRAMSIPAGRDSSFSGMRPTDKSSVSQSNARSVPGMGRRSLSTWETTTCSTRFAPRISVTVWER